MAPVALIGWDTTEDEWLAARRTGIGGSDVAAVLGFSSWSTPWQVWAEKTGTASWASRETPAAALGKSLEPWLRDQASDLVGAAVYKTKARTYGHADHPWRIASPDGVFANGHLLEAKTGGLTGYGAAPDWEGGKLPLAYEFQTRWAMHVMDAPAVHVVALIAGHGLVHRVVTRDLGIERDMVEQVHHWWATHIDAGIEPAATWGDSEPLTRLYPAEDPERTVNLDGTAAEAAVGAYRKARAVSKRAEQDKEAAAARIKQFLGDADTGLVGGTAVVTWRCNALGSRVLNVREAA